MDSIKIVNMEKESTTSPTKMFIWEIGNKINFMGMVFTFILMAINTRASLVRDTNPEEESTVIKVVQFIKDNGSKIEKVDLESTFIPTNKNMRETG